MRLGLLLVAVVMLAGCSRNPGPSYPSDWPRLSSETAKVSSGQTCPDLTGVYDMPKNAAAYLRGARRKGEFEFVHHFLGVNSQHGGWLAMPAKMTLEGPNEQGLKVAFYRPDGTITREGVLQAGVEFTCNGKWITETMGRHGENYRTTSYARDEEGRLIGFKGNSAAYAGVFYAFNAIPLPVVGVSFDRVWWRVEPGTLP